MPQACENYDAVASVMAALRALEAAAGRHSCEDAKFKLQGCVEADATNVRRMCVSLKNERLDCISQSQHFHHNNAKHVTTLGDLNHKTNVLTCLTLTAPLVRPFSDSVQEWKRTHPGKRPQYLLLYWRWAGLLERGRNGKFLVAELPHKLVAPSGIDLRQNQRQMW